jgi:hypothetical protein
LLMTYYTNAICSYIKLVLQSVFITVRFFRIDYNSLASMNVKSPLSSSEYISKPCFCISSLRLDNLPFSDFVVSAIINISFREKEICRTAIRDVAAVAETKCISRHYCCQSMFLLPLSFCNKYHLFHLLHNCKSDLEILTSTLVRFIATWTTKLGRSQLQSGRSSP